MEYNYFQQLKRRAFRTYRDYRNTLATSIRGIVFSVHFT